MMKRLLSIPIILLFAIPCQAAQKTVTVGTALTPASLDTNFGNIQDNFNELYLRAVLPATTANNDIAIGNGTTWALKTLAQAQTIIGNGLAITGNAGTATALAANGSNCSAGYASLGVDASGAVESCWQITPAAIGAQAEMGLDDNYATDAEKTKLSNLSGTNTGDQTASGVAFTPNGSIIATDVQTAIQEVRDEAGGYTNLTSFTSQTAWRLFYSNTSGDVTELAFGSDGTYLRSNGAAAAPTFDTPTGAVHDAVTLDTNLGANLLGLSTQQLTLDSQTANYIFSAPNGSAGVPSFRALVSADIPTLNQNTTGTAAGLTSQYVDWNSASGGSSIANKPTLGSMAAVTNPLTTAGDLWLAGTAGVAGRLGIGTDNYVLTISPSTHLPVWAAAATGYTNLTSFIGQTAWRVFYSDASGDVQELELGADGTFLKSNGAALAPSFATPSTHDALTLDTNLGNNLLGLSTQQITLDSQTANYVFAAPNGSAGVPSFRALVATDVPTLNQNTTGTAGGLSGTPNITVGTVTAATYSSSCDGATNPCYSTFPINASGTPYVPTASTKLIRMYNNDGVAKLSISDTEYNLLHSGLIGSSVQAYDADLTTYAGITPSANIQTLLGSADFSAARTNLGLAISTNVQAYDADLTTWAGVTPGSNVGTFLSTPSSANLATALTDEVGTGHFLMDTDSIIGTSLQVPNGANPTTDAAGEIAVDTSTGAGQGIRAYGAIAFTLPAYKTKCTTINAVTTASDFPIERFPYAVTIRAIHVYQSGATNVVGGLDECTGTGGICTSVTAVDADITGTADAYVDDDGTLTNAAVTAGNGIFWHTTSVSGTNTYTMVCFDYTVDQVN